LISARLSVGPGEGRLARRADGLLFVDGRPDQQRWEPIIDAYLGAPAAGDAREAVTAAAVEAGFALDAFVMVAWADAIELLVLGAVEVRTDLPSVPVLSGTASATWVEHRVARPPATAQLAAGNPATAGTRLDAGAVAAGGFVLALVLDDPQRPAWPAPDAPIAAEQLDPESTISPPAALATQVAAVAAASRIPGLVRARRCTRGHANPPHAAQCRTCGDLIGAGSAVEMIAQPVLGHVVLPDGSAIAVNGTSVLGRKPGTEAARVESTARLVPLAVDAGVSRTHVVIRAEGWTMTATDCGSRGRTVLRSPGAPDPEVLEPWVPHELQPGDTLYLGGPTHLQVVAAQ
jgi:FHA domain-containing protein